MSSKDPADFPRRGRTGTLNRDLWQCRVTSGRDPSHEDTRRRSVGLGRRRALCAAEAVELALKQIAPDVEVQNRDVLDFTNAVFRRVYAKAYLDLVNNFPHFVGYFYDWLEGDGEVRPRTRDKLREAAQELNLLAFERFLHDEQWDLVINTHFLPAELISKLRTSGKLNLPQVTVCTDFDTHRLWVNQPTDRYFCATDEGSLHLQHYGVPAADIDVTGIPIHPVFAEPADRGAVWLSRDSWAIVRFCFSSVAASASARSRLCFVACSPWKNRPRSWWCAAATRN